MSTCEKCGKYPATTHFKQDINGTVTERHLCQRCAREENIDNFFFNPFSFDFSDFLGSVFGEPAGLPETKTCPGCGMSFNEISKSGRVGCADCYQTFRKDLIPIIARVHGKTNHIGKVSESAGAYVKTKRRLERLKDQLKAAVEHEAYEEAARIRDEIKILEQEKGGAQNA